jgi:branched-chain amino acid transport system ATP-binding protein
VAARIASLPTGDRLLPRVPAGVEPLLCIRGLSVRFGGIVALNDVSFDVDAGQICGLIGPNGAGKTTIFNCLSRLYTPAAGSIRFAGRDLLELAAYDIAGLGIGRTFQNVALFSSLSVMDNILTGAHALASGGIVADVLRLPIVSREHARILTVAEELAELLDLTAVRDMPVAQLPFGTRKRVELARALAGRPKLLLLDEPAGGLNHEDVDYLRQQIVTLRDKIGITVLLVEHHMNLVMRVSDKVVALDFGRKIADGSPADVQATEAVVKAYLGS